MRPLAKFAVNCNFYHQFWARPPAFADDADAADGTTALTGMVDWVRL